MKITLTLLGVLISGLWAQAEQSIFPITQSWKYNTNNLSAANWKTPGYDDSAWASGAGLLYVENNTGISPRNTALPTRDGTFPYLTYYFRTTFSYSGPTDAVMLIFRARVDDGAVFYLNGIEVQRVRMPQGTVTYSTPATSNPPGGDATADDTFYVPGTALVNGPNVLAAEVHQTSSTSTDVVFGTSLAYGTGEVVRGPYLQVGTPTSIVIRWRTDLATNSQVIYGTNSAARDLTNTIQGARTEHEVKLATLLPETRYYYTVGTTGAVLASSTNQQFVTSPVSGSPRPVRIWVIGDAGTANASQQAVRNAFYQANGNKHVDLWLQLGDNAYDTGTDTEYQAAVFNMYPTLLSRSVTWPALGNHETAQSTAAHTNYPYFDIFTLPRAGEAGGEPSGTENYYSFDYANIHFICLDSMISSRSSSGPMATWLVADLQANTNHWVIAYWHHPPYTKGSHNSDTELPLIEMRQNILPILESYGVDLVLAGHSHCYERSRLLNGHYGLSSTLSSAMVLDSGAGRENETGAYKKPKGHGIPNRGAVYAVAGSSGKISGGSLNHPVMCVSLNVLGSMLIDVNTNRLDAVFLRDTGATNDYFTILKENTRPAATNLNLSVAANSSTTLALAGSDLNRDSIQFATTSLPTNGLVSNLNTSNGEFTYTPARACTNTDHFTYIVNDGATNSIPALVELKVTAPMDKDSDGLPDAWELQNGVTDPASDADTDGVSALHEYYAGTDPNDGNSWLRISWISGSPQAGFSLVWPSAGGVRYRVQFSNTDPEGGFTGVFTPIARSASSEIDPSSLQTHSTMSFIDDFSLTGVPAKGRYYRIEIVR